MPYFKRNPSGCGEFHGNVKDRIDYILSPGDYLYDDRRYYQPDWESPEAKVGYQGEVDEEGSPKDPADLRKWVDSLPHIWLDERKFHTHFLYFDPDVTEAEIEKIATFHLPNFYAAWCAGYADTPGGMRKGWYRGELDEDAKPKDPVRFQRESQGLETDPDGRKYRSEVRPARYEFLDSPEIFALRKAQAEQKAEELKSSTLSIQPEGRSGEVFPSTEIDVGSEAINRNAYVSINVYTYIEENNPANDEGVIDTFELWFFSTGSDVKVGVNEEVSSNTFTTTDYESIGSVTSGSKQSFTGLDCDVKAGDYIALTGSGGQIERDSSGGSTNYWYNGGAPQFPFSSESFSHSSLWRDFSLYGTGETGAPVVVTPATATLSITTYPPTVLVSDNQEVTPSPASLSITEYSPEVTASDHQEVIPATIAMTLAGFAPAVSTPRLVTPSTLGLTIASYIPNIIITEDKTVTPGVLALNITPYAPSALTPVLVTPATKTLNITPYAPAVDIDRMITPPTLGLTLTGYAPTIIAPATITIPTLALTIATYAPTITITEDKVAIPPTLALTLTTFAPTVTAAYTCIPSTLGLTLTPYAPTVTATAYVIVTPPTLALTLSLLAPDVFLTVTLAAALPYILEARDSSEDLLAFLHNAHGIRLTEEVNRPPMLDFMLPADDTKLEHVTQDCQIWLRDYRTGELKHKFTLGHRRDRRD